MQRQRQKSSLSKKVSLHFVESFTFFERVFPHPCLVPAAGRRIPNPSGGRRGSMLGACALQALSFPSPFRLLPKFPTASVSMPGWLALCYTTLTHSHQKHNVTEGRRGMMRYRQEIRDQSKKKKEDTKCTRQLCKSRLLYLSALPLELPILAALQFLSRPTLSFPNRDTISYRD